MILLPKYRDIEIPIALKRPRFAGHYKLEAVGLDGRVRLLAEFDNIITNNGADLLGNNSPLTFCSVGSGNTAPSVTQTALTTFVASTSSINSNTFTSQSTSPYFGTNTVQYAFPIGGATGNLSEVGVGVANNGTNLFSRALILDGGGSPTTITVLSSEALYVTYQLNQYVPLTDVVGNITIAGVNYSYTLRAQNATSTNWCYRNGDAGGISNGGAIVYNGSIGAITSSPSGTPAQASSLANNSYSTGSFTLSGTATWTLTSGNLSGGVTAASVNFGTSQGSRGQYQIGFGSAIPKDSSHVLTLSFGTSWTINTT
jgi:hypothetical protein